MYRKPYIELLKDPLWQKKRLEVLASKHWICEVCYSDNQTLHVHHKHYVQGRNPWEYAEDQFAVLCEICHKARHEADQKIHDLLARVDVSGMPAGVDDLYWLIAGFMGVPETPEIHAQKALYAIGKAASDGCWHGFKGFTV